MVVEPSPHARLADDPVLDLRPVPPLASPWCRAAVRIALLAPNAAGLARVGDTNSLRQRIVLVPYVGWTMLASALAVMAASQTSAPRRDPRWGLLPLPSLLFWVAVSSLGCMTAAADKYGHPASLRSAPRESPPLFLMVSLPLSAMQMVMPRINVLQRFDVAAVDLWMHGPAVIGIIAVRRSFGWRWLGSECAGA